MHDDDARLLTAGAVLGDLDAAEWRARSVELACAECADLELGLRDTLADLALLAPRRVPPDSLLAGVKAAIREADAVSAPARPAPVAARPPASLPGPVNLVSFGPRRRRAWMPVALAAALVVAAAGLGATTARLSGDLNRTQADAARLQAQVDEGSALMATLANPAHRTATLHAEPLAPSAAAQVVYLPGTSESWIVATGMPATPAGEVYQLWYADAAGAHPLATSDWNGTGVMVVPVGIDLTRSAAVMVTLEPVGGATGAPGPEVVFGEL